DEPHPSADGARLPDRDLRCFAAVTQLTEQGLEARHFRIRLTRTVPEIRVLVGLGLLHRSSFSRSIVMPRCRLTRTDAGVSPVRSAISGLVSPSTSLRTSVSRYAAGRVRMISSTPRAS